MNNCILSLLLLIAAVVGGEVAQTFKVPTLTGRAVTTDSQRRTQ